jgi:hypothetical protein
MHGLACACIASRIPTPDTVPNIAVVRLPIAKILIAFQWRLWDAPN